VINTVLTGKSGFVWIDVVNPTREELDQIALTYKFKNRPKAEDIFTSQFLPPAAERKM